MKTYFSLTILITVFISCYSFEFHPVSEYPNLKKNNIHDVSVTTIRPKEGFITLGTLIVHDFSGNILDPAFQSAIKREAKKRGAEGAWISKIKLKKTVRLQGSAPMQSNYMQNNYYNQSQIQGTIGIVEVVLYNWQTLSTE
ncbi:MAG: hypothetical protein OEZ34_05430 [Spirochaetia bacterium]|nr:hypothetical protein [Spirochaetia bacterium]